MKIAFLRTTHKKGQYRWTRKTEPKVSRDAGFVLHSLDPVTWFSLETLMRVIRKYERDYPHDVPRKITVEEVLAGLAELIRVDMAAVRESSR